ncbi:hypothetical protein ACOSP7_008202 [Xanthoceras sorbifolium]|uniref:Endonuclease/exonuclease/phosphatase domain-containing protein n=1 Tax=Xanthoceras sorbifolium TaxID=99658 RepID=A0ABQ8IC27_9ROSI|nr:hypothetical protein JRO89_XS03G0261500 [Xanthoceras sorbifolium]
MSRFLRIHFLVNMSSRSTYRGGRNQWGRRGFSERPYNNSGRGHFVSGDSHYRSVRDSNLGFRQGTFSNQSPHPQFRQQPPYNRNPQFRQPPPPPFVRNQAMRPRPPKPLDYRNWEHAKAAPPPDSDRFLVLSYNILADYLAFSHRNKLYFHIPRKFLDWEWRKNSILFELGLWSADIMCFQEVDRFEDLEEELKVRGYHGIWKMRTGNAIDGCAIFWRTSRFKLLFEESIEFNKLGLRDNVAQICVLELFSQNHTDNTAALPTSSAPSNKVVVCNIHVLYNPKRGEIKLGQVRTLLARAHDVSKIWDDAPVVLCGDFNCTPKSPLYNFISERKLDLSGVDRDKVSGQASAEIRASKPYNPNPRGQTADGSIQTPSVVGGGSVGVQSSDPLSDIQNHNKHGNAEIFPFVNKLSPSQSTETVLGGSDKACSNTQCGNDDSALVDEVTTENKQIVGDGFKGELGSAFSIPIDSLKESSSCLQSEGKFSTSEGQINDEIHEISTSRPSHSEVDNYSTTYQNEVSSSIDILVTEKLENLSLSNLDEATVEGGSIDEDDNTFLSALHDTKDAFAPDLDPCSKELGDENLDDLSPSLDSEAVDVEKTGYDPSLWTPMEIATATGNGDCTFLEHPLQLRSTYAEVEDCSGSRDSNGEPLVTSYNRCFLGTVDYIWRSEGLQTVRVLAPIPKHAMQWTPGYPTKKWGSDHIALASEVAFMKP